MAYGTFSTSIKTYYNRVNYTLSGKTYSGVHIFRTKGNTAPKDSIIPAIYPDKELIANMNPAGVAPANVMAKTNASPMTYGKNGDPFYGLAYVGGKLYLSGELIPDKKIGLPDNYYPCFCIKTDNTAIIRWFRTTAELSTALPYIKGILPACQPLVYTSKSVFENNVVDSTTKKRICNPSNLNDSACHYNDNYLGNITNSSKNRTLLGHAANGVFYMVCVDSGMTLPVAAKMMCDLGCDYAVNMDGGTASIMRVASSYRNGISPNSSGNMNSRGSDYYGIITCAYKL